MNWGFEMLSSFFLVPEVESVHCTLKKLFCEKIPYQLSPHPWRYLKDICYFLKMCHLETWFNAELGSAGLGLDDLTNLFQPK